MNTREPDEVTEGYLNTTFPSRTVLGINIPETCRGCGTVQSCNLRTEGMTDLCTGKQPAPEGSIRIGLVPEQVNTKSDSGSRLLTGVSMLFSLLQVVILAPWVYLILGLGWALLTL